MLKISFIKFWVLLWPGGYPAVHPHCQQTEYFEKALLGAWAWAIFPQLKYRAFGNVGKFPTRFQVWGEGEGITLDLIIPRPSTTVSSFHSGLLSLFFTWIRSWCKYNFLSCVSHLMLYIVFFFPFPDTQKKWLHHILLHGFTAFLPHWASILGDFSVC